MLRLESLALCPLTSWLAFGHRGATKRSISIPPSWTASHNLPSKNSVFSLVLETRDLETLPFMMGHREVMTWL